MNDFLIASAYNCKKNNNIIDENVDDEDDDVDRIKQFFKCI